MAINHTSVSRCNLRKQWLTICHGGKLGSEFICDCRSRGGGCTVHYGLRDVRNSFPTFHKLKIYVRAIYGNNKVVISTDTECNKLTEAVLQTS